jgi:hypothetical protein
VDGLKLRFQLLEKPNPGFDKENIFALFGDFTLPPVMGLAGRGNRDTGREPRLDQGSGDLPAFFFAWDGRQNEKEIGQCFSPFPRRNTMPAGTVPPDYG